MFFFDSFPFVFKSVLCVPRAILLPTKNAHKIFVYEVINVNFSVKTDILIIYKKV
jgi:hypothetical protein